jgi:hypothetical protein
MANPRAGGTAFGVLAREIAQRKRSGMRKRKYLIGAMLGVLGALVVSGTAMAGQPISHKFTSIVAPAKQNKKTFGGASIHTITDTTYDNFLASPSSSTALFTFSKDIKVGINGNLPPCTQNALQSSASTAAVQAACGGSIVGQGSALVNSGQAPFTAPNPVLLLSGGRNVLYVWLSIQGGTTVVLNGQVTSRTLLITGLPNVPGVDLTVFDTTINKKKTGKKTFYVMARCTKKKKWTSSETVTFHNGQQLSASSTQKCKQKK